MFRMMYNLRFLVVMLDFFYIKVRHLEEFVFFICIICSMFFKL